MDIKPLKEIGLSTTESKVYLALLGLKSSLAGEITKVSGINRTNVYDALERLTEKGLVTHIINTKRKVFEPVNPIRLQEILKERQENLNAIMKELQTRYKQIQPREKAFIFEGKKGIKAIFEDILKERKGLLVYGAEGIFGDILPAYQEWWNKRRAKLRINIKIIYSQRVKKRKLKENLKLIKLKFLSEKYEFPSTILIYGEKVTTITWGDLPRGFMIQSEKAAKSYTLFFNRIWNAGKRPISH